MAGRKTTTKFFPWSPGIPWQISTGGVVFSTLPAELFFSIVKDKEIVVCAFGGLLETFFSLCILELLNAELPGHTIYWAGNPEYYSIIKTNGIAKIFSDVTKKDTRRFPSPIFLDKNNRVYINSLYNYIKIENITRTYKFLSYRAASEQCIRNGILQWKNIYLPSFRVPSNNFIQICKIYGINPNKQFTLIIPKTKYSEHEQKGIEWNETEFKSFSAMMEQAGHSIVIMSDKLAGWSNSKAKRIPFNFDLLIPLLQNASFVISTDVDYLLIANMISDAVLISEYYKHALSLEKNNIFFGEKNDIYHKQQLTPIDAVKFIGKYGTDSSHNDGNL